MICIDTKDDHEELRLVVEDEEDLAKELAGILTVFKDHFPEALDKALRVIDECEAEVEECTLDDLFEECMKELDLFMKVRGDNNAKS